MRNTSALACLIGSLWLGGCAHHPTSEEFLESPEVAARCTPVKSLLSKNFRVSGSTEVPWLFNFGGLYDRTGAVLNSAEAARVASVDAACRAWVNGAITPAEYGRFVLDNTSVTIVQTTSPADREGVVDAVVKYLDNLKTRGNLPKQLDPSAIPEQVASDSQLTQQQLQAKVRASLSEIEGKLSTVGVDADTRQAQIISRLDSIDRRLFKLEPATTPVSGSIYQPPLPTPSVGTDRPVALGFSGSTARAKDKLTEGLSEIDIDSLDVYFATGSSEIPFSERQRIEAASASWSKTYATVYVMGFADPRGPLSYNRSLSLSRAQAVADILVQLNVKVGAVSGGGIASGAENDSLRYVHMRRVQLNSSLREVSSNE